MNISLNMIYLSPIPLNSWEPTAPKHISPDGQADRRTGGQAACVILNGLKIDITSKYTIFSKKSVKHLPFLSNFVKGWSKPERSRRAKAGLKG